MTGWVVSAEILPIATQQCRNDLYDKSWTNRSYEAMNGSAKCRKWVVWGGWGHSRSWAMPPFDRAHTTSYSTLIETMCLSFTFFRYSQLFVKSRRFWPIPPAFGALVGVDPGRISRRSLTPESQGYRVVLFDPTFSRFSRTPTYDRHRQTQTDTGPWLVPRMHSIARSKRYLFSTPRRMPKKWPSRQLGICHSV